MDFSPDPSGRYRSDGNASGEAFREDILLPAMLKLNPDEELIVILDNGVESYGSSFLTEGFAGVIKFGHIRADELLRRLKFRFKNPDFTFYAEKIRNYCLQAKFGSQVYVPTVERS